jgi:hypothetical protein
MEKIHLYICAIAAIVALLACIAVGAEIYEMALIVSVTIGVFYIIGQCIRMFLITSVFPPEPPAEETEEFADLEDENEDEVQDDDIVEDLHEPIEDAFLDD